MANSLRVKLSKLRHDGNITNKEYEELIKKIDGHDKVLKHSILNEFTKYVCDYIDVYGTGELAESPYFFIKHLKDEFENQNQLIDLINKECKRGNINEFI